MSFPTISRVHSSFIVVAIIAFACAGMVRAQVPPHFSYQGRLTDSVGNPMNATVTLTMTVYDDELRTNVMWADTIPGVVATDGLFNVILGDLNPIPDTAFTGPIRFMGIAVNSDPEISELIPLVTVPYSFKAGNATYAESAGEAELAINVPDNSIASNHILDHSISGEDIADNGADPGQVLKWNGVSWVPSDDNTGGGNGGWVDDGTVVRLATNSDSVGIGTTSPSHRLEVVGPILFGYNNQVLDTLSTVGGGEYNAADSTSVVAGGIYNVALASYSTIGGGLQNNVGKGGGTIGGGQLNTIYQNGVAGTIGGGSSNIIEGQIGTIAGGEGNFVDGDFGTVGGGTNNTVLGNRGTVCGGYADTASGGNSAVGGGQLNKAAGDQSVVSGGQENLAQGWRSTVGGGYSDTAFGDYSTVSGGYENLAAGNRSAVSGGYNNTASGDNSAVGGGQLNTSSGDQSVVSGGEEHLAFGWRSVIGGGYADTARGELSVISGGAQHKADSTCTTISGGFGHRIEGAYSTVGGGLYNLVNAAFSTISGGSSNVIEFGSLSSSVGGGTGNQITGDHSTIAGGHGNSIVGNYGFIGGGGGYLAYLKNSISAFFGTIGGGQSNSVSAEYGTIGGGYDNTCGSTADDTAVFVGGGVGNSATAKYACLTGGRSNSITGSYSFIGGGSKHLNQGTSCVIPGGESDTIGFWATHSMAFGKQVFISDAYRVILYDGTNSGRLGVNRDDDDGGIDHPIHVGTNTSNGNGAHLTATGVWTDASSQSFKTDFRKLDRDWLLNGISRIDIASWRYKESAGKHIGPVAEDFAGIFGVGNTDESGSIDDKYLSPADVAGVALAGVKELLQENRNLKEQILELEERIAVLEALE